MKNYVKVSWKLNEGDFRILTRKLEDLAGSKARSKIAQALNKTATQGKKFLAVNAGDVYTADLKVSGFKKAMRTQRASPSNLVATLHASGSPLSMRRFSHGESVVDGALIDITNTGLKPVHNESPRAFWGKGRIAGNVFARTGKPAKRYKGKEASAYRGVRGGGVPPSREALEKKAGKSTPYMLGSPKVWTPSSAEIGMELQDQMRQQIETLLG